MEIVADWNVSLDGDSVVLQINLATRDQAVGLYEAFLDATLDSRYPLPAIGRVLAEAVPLDVCRG